MTKDEILAALPTMAQADLEAIQAMTNHLLGGHTGPQARPGGMVAPMVFDALASALGVITAYSNYNHAVFKQLDQRMPGLVVFLNANFKGWDRNKITQLAFLKMLFGLLIDDLKDKRVTPTVGILIINIPRIPEVFEKAFPNYLKTGLGKLVLKTYK